jgi:zinc transporter ZupT
MNPVLPSFLSGLAAAGFVLASLFFLRFWRRTKDYLFAAFSAAFLLLALNQAIATLANIPDEYQSWIYVLKLAAFVILLIAIIGKNMTRRPIGRL